MPTLAQFPLSRQVLLPRSCVLLCHGPVLPSFCSFWPGPPPWLGPGPSVPLSDSTSCPTPPFLCPLCCCPSRMISLGQRFLALYHLFLEAGASLVGSPPSIFCTLILSVVSLFVLFPPTWAFCWGVCPLHSPLFLGTLKAPHFWLWATSVFSGSFCPDTLPLCGFGSPLTLFTWAAPSSDGCKPPCQVTSPGVLEPPPPEPLAP